jgi:hypothetical protein
VLQVKGFPTLKFVVGETGDILDYSGDRSKEDLIKFVKQHSRADASTSSAEEADAEPEHDEL